MPSGGAAGGCVRLAVAGGVGMHLSQGRRRPVLGPAVPYASRSCSQCASTGWSRERALPEGETFALPDEILRPGGRRGSSQALRQEPQLGEPSHAVDYTARIERRQVLGSLISEYCATA
jgi:hypothetical protein